MCSAHPMSCLVHMTRSSRKGFLVLFKLETRRASLERRILVLPAPFLGPRSNIQAGVVTDINHRLLQLQGGRATSCVPQQDQQVPERELVLKVDGQPVVQYESASLHLAFPTASFLDLRALATCRAARRLECKAYDSYQSESSKLGEVHHQSLSLQKPTLNFGCHSLAARWGVSEVRGLVFPF